MLLMYNKIIIEDHGYVYASMACFFLSKTNIVINFLNGWRGDNSIESLE